MIATHLQSLADQGVITVDALGVVRLTRAAWRAATEFGPYSDYKCLHFVGFKDDRFYNAVKVWGKPDFIHRFWDHRAVGDIAPFDTVVFADAPGEPRENSFDDSANW